MKKWLLILGMITCMMGLTACGAKEDETEYITEDQAMSLANDCVSIVSQVVNQQAEEDYLAMVEQNGADVAVFEKAFESWKNASEDMGTYQAITGISSNTMTTDRSGYVSEGVIVADLDGDVRDATIEIIYEDGMPTSITTNVIYSFGESMEKAALNTLLGMGTVFVVLILISAIISCFNFIPKIQAMFAKKPAKEEERAAAVDNTIAQIIEKEELSDDLELVAVIAAAIAASEGAASTDGFVVRSIRRAGNRWKRS
ncbi:MAG: OadG family protein [Lachnospiraceae bacterium]|nr:OadG family protein [Lachnospiraceae bacterium]